MYVHKPMVKFSRIILPSPPPPPQHLTCHLPLSQGWRSGANYRSKSIGSAPNLHIKVNIFLYCMKKVTFQWNISSKIHFIEKINTLIGLIRHVQTLTIGHLSTSMIWWSQKKMKVLLTPLPSPPPPPKKKKKKILGHCVKGNEEILFFTI